MVIDEVEKDHYLKIVSVLGQLYNRGLNDFEHLIQAHPEWDPYRDIRITAIARFVTIFATTMIGFELIVRNLNDELWWQGLPFTHRSGPFWKKYTKAFSSQLTFAFVHTTFSVIENGLRLILGSLDNNMDTSAKFQSVYGRLLRDRLSKKLNDGIALLELLSLLRNSIHNNGVFFDPSSSDRSVTYKNSHFIFQHGKTINFITWDLLLALTSDMYDLYYTIIMEDKISMIGAIIDPFERT